MQWWALAIMWQTRMGTSFRHSTAWTSLPEIILEASEWQKYMSMLNCSINSQHFIEPKSSQDPPPLLLSWSRSILSAKSHSTSFKTHFNIILPSMPWSSKQSFSFRISDQNVVWILSPIHTSSSSHLPWLENKLWISSLCNFFQPHVISSLLGSEVHSAYSPYLHKYS
jgi:hypothetical protein